MNEMELNNTFSLEHTLILVNINVTGTWYVVIITLTRVTNIIDQGNYVYYAAYHPPPHSSA